LKQRTCLLECRIGSWGVAAWEASNPHETLVLGLLLELKLSLKLGTSISLLQSPLSHSTVARNHRHLPSVHRQSSSAETRNCTCHTSSSCPTRHGTLSRLSQLVNLQKGTGRNGPCILRNCSIYLPPWSRMNQGIASASLDVGRGAYLPSAPPFFFKKKGGEQNMAAVVISLARLFKQLGTDNHHCPSNSPFYDLICREPTYRNRWHGDTRKAMQEQGNVAPHSQAIVPLDVHLHTHINMQLCKPTWHQTFSRRSCASFPAVSTCFSRRILLHSLT
jgi:hypothetical protein